MFNCLTYSAGWAMIIRKFDDEVLTGKSMMSNMRD